MKKVKMFQNILFIICILSLVAIGLFARTYTPWEVEGEVTLITSSGSNVYVEVDDETIGNVVITCTPSPYTSSTLLPRLCSALMLNDVIEFYGAFSPACDDPYTCEHKATRLQANR